MNCAGRKPGSESRCGPFASASMTRFDLATLAGGFKGDDERRRRHRHRCSAGMACLGTPRRYYQLQGPKRFFPLSFGNARRSQAL
jgi:hypothetical protein